MAVRVDESGEVRTMSSSRSLPAAFGKAQHREIRIPVVELAESAARNDVGVAGAAAARNRARPSGCRASGPVPQRVDVLTDRRRLGGVTAARQDLGRQVEMLATKRFSASERDRLLRTVERQNVGAAAILASRRRIPCCRERCAEARRRRRDPRTAPAAGAAARAQARDGRRGARRGRGRRAFSCTGGNEIARQMGVERGHRRCVGRGGAKADETVRPNEDGPAAGRAGVRRAEPGSRAVDDRDEPVPARAHPLETRRLAEHDEAVAVAAHAQALGKANARFGRGGGRSRLPDQRTSGVGNIEHRPFSRRRNDLVRG